MPVDLRSDTVTQPCGAMRRAMADAAVGDDVYNEDPTVRALEQRVAGLLGKPAALFVPSGTMANQIALKLHCQPGDAVVVSAGTHCMVYESGAAAALAGVQFSVACGEGIFDRAALEAAIGARDLHAAPARLVVLENTHNRAGGVVWPPDQLLAVASHAREAGLAVHLDGARLWNASVASGASLAELAQPADTVSVCFSKGLGAPVGSALVGDAQAIARARRFRKMLGGGMRQAGVLAAGALHALEHHLPEVERDHARTKQLHQALASTVEGLAPPQSNMLIVPVPHGAHAAEWAREAAAQGLLCSALDPSHVRLVVHRDLDDGDVEYAGGIVGALYTKSLSTGGGP